MSVVLVWPPPSLGRALVTTLLKEGDEVRVIVPPTEGDDYRALGAYVATGDPFDPDLVERACQGARTIVFADTGGSFSGTFEPALEGARRAGVGRAIVSTARPNRRVSEVLANDPGDYVHLLSARGVFRKTSDEALAAAVNAADDLSGVPRTIVDLSTEEGWRALGLEPR